MLIAGSRPQHAGGSGTLLCADDGVFLVSIPISRGGEKKERKGKKRKGKIFKTVTLERKIEMCGKQLV